MMAQNKENVQILTAIKVYKNTWIGIPCTTPDFSITMDFFFADNTGYPRIFGIAPIDNIVWRNYQLLVVASANNRASGVGVHINGKFLNTGAEGTKYFNARSTFKMENWKIYKNGTQILDASSLRQNIMNDSFFWIGGNDPAYTVFYGAEIYVEDILKGNIYPAKLGTDIGFYNSVTGDFFASIGASEHS